MMYSQTLQMEIIHGDIHSSNDSSSWRQPIAKNPSRNILPYLSKSFNHTTTPPQKMTKPLKLYGHVQV